MPIMREGCISTTTDMTLGTLGVFFQTSKKSAKFLPLTSCNTLTTAYVTCISFSYSNILNRVNADGTPIHNIIYQNTAPQAQHTRSATSGQPAIGSDVKAASGSPFVMAHC